jgi:hypothetical protein
MKINFSYLILTIVLLFQVKVYRGQTNIDFTDKQIQGYTLFGLGFTTVAYTYSGPDRMSGSGVQPAVFYAVGSGLAVTGLILLLSEKNRKPKKNNWMTFQYDNSSIETFRRQNGDLKGKSKRLKSML